MSEFGFVLLIIFLVIVAPIWIIAHYATKNSRAKRFTGEQEEMLNEIWESAQRMEDRIETLERILDDDTPGWRRSKP